MLIPIGRDDAEIRRHAWVSYAIIALNILMFAVMISIESSSTKEFDRRFREAVQYQIQHPYLKTPPRLQKMLTSQGNAQLDQMRADYGRVNEAQVAHEQVKLDRLADQAVLALDDEPRSKLAYVPERGGFLTMFTSMFLHADFFHLFGNLLFFYLSGPFIEDVFGRPLFAFLYFMGGIAALLTFLAQHPDSIARLMGASGAIAAVMGAYLVRFARSKIEFLFMPFWWRPQWHFRFWMPAFVVLPLWFFEQLWAMMRTEGAGGGVAFSAHVGGFVFGVVVALIVKFTKFEEKFVNPVVIAQTTWAMDDRLIIAMDARKFGNLDGAKQTLDAMMRDANCPQEALQVAMDVAVEAEDPARYDVAASRLLARHVEAKDADLAMDLIREVTGSDRFAHIPKFLSRAAPIVERSGDREWAILMYERLYDLEPGTAAAVAALMKLGALKRLQGDVNGARAAFIEARAHPACTPEWVPSIEAKLAQLK